MENKRALVLHEMWVAGRTLREIGVRFGVSDSTISQWAKKYHLPPRQRCKPDHATADPTPEEIERLKAELKEIHLAERRAEPPCNTDSKVSKWRRGRCQPRGVA